MTKVHIVTVSSGWILQKISNRIADNNTNEDYSFTVGHEPDMDADINYYVDLENCYRGVKTNCDIAFFSHADQDNDLICLEVMSRLNGWQLDGIVHMNYRYHEMLERIGYPKEKMTTIIPGETKDMFPLKDTTIGIVSRGGYPGYGHGFLEFMFQHVTMEGFRFKFLGNGWEPLLPIAEEYGIKMEIQGDQDYSVYPQFYQDIDYLLIPGLWTAGPMSMQEALSSGVPIIASNVGFVGYEFEADHVFEPGDAEGLYRILCEINQPKIKRRQQVEHMSWENYTNQLIDFFKEING
jgi:glycosyltransferase involved in cell wall biosynthesis